MTNQTKLKEAVEYYKDVKLPRQFKALLDLANLVLSIKGVNKLEPTHGMEYENGFNNCHYQFTTLRAKQLMGIRELIRQWIVKLLEIEEFPHIIDIDGNDIDTLTQTIHNLFTGESQ